MGSGYSYNYCKQRESEIIIKNKSKIITNKKGRKRGQRRTTITVLDKVTLKRRVFNWINYVGKSPKVKILRKQNVIRKHITFVHDSHRKVATICQPGLEDLIFLPNLSVCHFGSLDYTCVACPPSLAPRVYFACALIFSPKLETTPILILYKFYR